MSLSATATPIQATRPYYSRQPNGYGRFRWLFNVVAGIALLLWAAGARAAEDGPLVVMLGDSLTAGYGLSAEDALPARLEANLRAGGTPVRIQNAGVSGDTTAGGHARLGWALADDPAIVVVALGANDGLRAIDPSETRANLDLILSDLKSRGITVLLAGMLAPPNLGRDYGDAFDALFPALAEKHEVAFYPFLLDGVAADPALNLSDGMHPNAEGVKVIADRMAPHLEALVNGAAARQD